MRIAKIALVRRKCKDYAFFLIRFFCLPYSYDLESAIKTHRHLISPSALMIFELKYGYSRVAHPLVASLSSSRGRGLTDPFFACFDGALVAAGAELSSGGKAASSACL